MHAISRTGTPRGHMKGNSAHVFGPANLPMRRAASANQYEGRELASKKLGSYGPGGYDVLRVSRTGTPRGHARGIPVFGAPADKTRPESAPYRIGSSDPDRLAQTALFGGTRYTGKDGETAEDPCKAQLGLFGARKCREAHIGAWDRPSRKRRPPTQGQNRRGPPERLKAQPAVAGHWRCSAIVVPAAFHAC